MISSLLLHMITLKFFWWCLNYLSSIKPFSYIKLSYKCVYKGDTTFKFQGTRPVVVWRSNNKNSYNNYILRIYFTKFRHVNPQHWTHFSMNFESFLWSFWEGKIVCLYMFPTYLYNQNVNSSPIIFIKIPLCKTIKFDI